MCGACVSMTLFGECVANFCMFCIFNLHFLFSFTMPISARSHCLRSTNVDEACDNGKENLKKVVFDGMVFFLATDCKQRNGHH